MGERVDNMTYKTFGAPPLPVSKKKRLHMKQNKTVILQEFDGPLGH